jgi:hypothetical protein
MKIAIVGDTHEEFSPLNRVLQDIHYSERDDPVEKVFVVGDFGLWTDSKRGQNFLNAIDYELNAVGMQLYALPGNHENWDHWEWFIENFPKDRDGFTPIRGNISLAPKFHTWVWDDMEFVSVGGAASVDKFWRIEDDKRYGGKSWFEQELITDEEVKQIPEGMDMRTDVLLTHDCSDKTPWAHPILPVLESELNRKRIDQIINRLNPTMHFHGHMHTKYDWYNGDTHTFGLDCDNTRWNWGVLDTNNMTFRWRDL